MACVFFNLDAGFVSNWAYVIHKKVGNIAFLKRKKKTRDCHLQN
jgi:hypothetical protein